MNIDRSAPFGEVLQTLREQKKISQQALAKSMGVHRNTIGKWESGDRLPATKTFVLELANKLDLNDEETRLLLETSLTGHNPYWYVPYQRNPFFTGRTAFLQTLHERLHAQQAVALCQSYVLNGLGGIGKTQLAVEYAYQHALNYQAVFWVGAETIDTLDMSFTAIAEALRLPEREEQDRQKIIKAVLRWIATHKEWLLIFDNVEDIALIKPFLPAIKQGAILLTTRLHSVNGIAHTFELPPLSREEGTRFLLHRARLDDTCPSSDNPPAELLTVAQTLVEMMGGLPLALDQAGAYIERTGCNLTDYLRLYRSHQMQLLNDRSLVADHPHSVVKTILLSFHRLTQANAAAADLLRICAFLAPDAIPEDFFIQGAAALEPSLEALITDAYSFNHILGEALQYSLLYRQPQYRTLSLHRLVQVVLRATMDEDVAHLWAFRAAAVVAACVTPLQEKHAHQRDDRYLPHARSILQHVQQWQDSEELGKLIPIWYYLGLVMEQHSQLTEARDAYLQGLEIARRFHSPLEAAFLVHIGCMISDLGDDQEALTYLEQGGEQARLLHDEDTLCFALLNQGQIQDNFGNYHLAETLYQEGVSIAQRIHDWAMMSAFLQDLGVQTLRRGDYDQTQVYYSEGLAYARRSQQLIRQSALLMNLGMLEIQQQHYEQALTHSLESLGIAERVHHRYRISSVSQNLGIIYRSLGQLEQAQFYLDESMRLAQEIQNSWLIAETQGEYGWLLLAQERPSKAEEIFEHMLTRAHEIQAQELIAVALFGLAHTAAKQNRYEQARSLAQDSLERFTQLENVQRHGVAEWLDSLK